MQTRPFVLALLVIASAVATIRAAEPRSATAPIQGLRDASPRVHALVGGRVIVSPGKVLENGTVVIRDGLIEAVGADLTPASDARVWDVHGRTLYAGFIESQSTLFLPAAWKPASAAPA